MTCKHSFYLWNGACTQCHHPCAVMDTSCQILKKILACFFQEPGQESSSTRFSHGFGIGILQGNKDSCKCQSWHGFGTDFLPTCQILRRLAKILQDVFDRVHAKNQRYVCVCHPGLGIPDTMCSEICSL